MKSPRDRIPYSAIVDRPPLKLPGNGRVAVWTIVNVEEWSIERPMPRTVLPPPSSHTAGQPLLPDLPNWAWHEYGMRVGFWRFLEVLSKFNLKATLAINGSVCKSYPRVAQAGLEAGWEFMGHGYLQRPMHHVEDQRAAIRQRIEEIKSITGKAPPAYAELWGRAEELLPVLRERAPRCEELRRMPDETLRDFHGAELFRIHQPKRVGGAELEFVAVVEFGALLARACASSSWNFINFLSHHLMLGMFPPRAQDEIWGASPDTLIASSFVFPAGKAKKVKGGYVLSGRWPFSSG